MVINDEMEEMDNINQSEQKRLKSLKEKKQQFRFKEQLVRDALNNLDNKPSNKKIIFDEDFEENVKNEIRGKTKKKRKALFENDEDEGEEDVNFEIDIDKSDKDMKLRQPLGNDKRFTLDKRFLDDEQEQEKQHKNSADSENFSDLQKEKEWQMDILENVLGTPIVIKGKKEPTQQKKAKMIRYDPTAANHEEYEVKNEKPVQATKDKKKKKTHELITDHKDQESEPIPVSKDIFYSVSDTLKESLNQEGGFSLLKTYGKEQENSNAIIDDQTEKDAPQVKQKFQFSFDTKNPFKYDSSDDENEEEKLENGETPEDLETTNEAQPSEISDSFFFSENDVRFNEAIQFFKETPAAAGDFNHLRRELKQIVRAKIRNNMKKNKPKRVKNIKSNKVKKIKKRK